MSCTFLILQHVYSFTRQQGIDPLICFTPNCFDLLLIPRLLQRILTYGKLFVFTHFHGNSVACGCEPHVIVHTLCIHKNEWARNKSYRRLTSRSPVQAENIGNHPVLVHSRSVGTSLIYSKTVLFNPSSNNKFHLSSLISSFLFCSL